MLRLAECLHVLLGAKKWNIAIILRDGCKTVIRRDVEKNNLQPLRIIKSELESLRLGCRPINIGHIFMQSVELVNDLHVQAFEDPNHLVVLELLSE